MDQGTAKARSELLRKIYRRVKACEAFFLDPDYLQRCGIQASQIGVLDGILQFEPCFFLPNQVNILEFPTEEVIEPMFEEASRPILPRPDFSDFPSLLSLFEKSPSSESALERTDRVYDPDLKRPYSLYDWSGNAKDIFCYIDAQLSAERVGLPHGACDGNDLIPLCAERTVLPGRGPWCQTTPRREIALEWELDEVMEDPSEKDLPHAIATMTAAVPANYADRSITLHEVKCLVRLMWGREACGPFWRDKIHPLLLISYMGQSHGRITQATFDGERLIIQYSQLFSFGGEDQASVELFLHNILSYPVSPGGLALPFRALGHDVDDHMDVDSPMLPELV